MCQYLSFLDILRLVHFSLSFKTFFTLTWFIKAGVNNGVVPADETTFKYLEVLNYHLNVNSTTEAVCSLLFLEVNYLFI